MTTIPDLCQTLQRLMTTRADELGKETGFIQRQRQVSASGFAQTVVFGGLGQPAGTRKELHQSAIRAGMQVSMQGLDQRFGLKGVDFMRRLLEAGMREMVVSEEEKRILPHFNGVYLSDCTQIRWGEAGVKVGVRLELQQGQVRPVLMDLKSNDQQASVVDEALPAGALHLGDLGFFKLARFKRWTDEGVYWLSRFKTGTRLFTLAGEPLDLKSHLTGSEPIRLAVKVGGRQEVTAILLAAPLTAQAREKRQARLQEQARLDQRPLSQQQLDLAEWTIYLTNIPNLTFAMAFILARTRWQIELLFKLWKSHAKIMTSRSADPIRQQVEGYARLLGVLIAHWMLLVSGWHYDCLGAVDALRILRTHIPLLQRAFRLTSLFTQVFRYLADDLQSATPFSKRRKHPLAFQLWHEFNCLYA